MEVFSGPYFVVFLLLLLIYSFIYLFIYLFIFLFIYLFIYLFIFLSIYLFIHLFIYLSIYLFIYLFILQGERRWGKFELRHIIFQFYYVHKAWGGLKSSHKDSVLYERTSYVLFNSAFELGFFWQMRLFTDEKPV